MRASNTPGTRRVPMDLWLMKTKALSDWLIDWLIDRLVIHQFNKADNLLLFDEGKEYIK